MISTASYSYNENVDKALNELKKIKLHNNHRYVLLFTYKHNINGTGLDMLSVSNYLDMFPEMQQYVGTFKSPLLTKLHC